MGQARSGYGTLLKRGDGGAPQTFTTIYGARSITLNGMQTDKVETTTHSSAGAGAFREYMVTLIDPGTLEFEINYDPADVTHIAIKNDWLNRTTRDWQIVLPNNIETISCTGYVLGGPIEFPTDDVITQKLTIQLTGALSFA